MSTTLPNFLVVGAAKSGTTSLYSNLNKHPEIYFPKTKEPSFFVADDVRHLIPTWVDTLAEYQSLFAGSEKFAARGEASVLYLYFFNTAIPNILKYLGPTTKIIICLRNPVDRAYSAYFDCHRFDCMEDLSFTQALAQESTRILENRHSPMTHYKAMGCYSAMVSAFLDAFTQVKVVLFDEFLTDEVRVVQDLCKFLGVTPQELSYTPANMGGKYWSNPRLGKLVKNAVPQGARRILSGYAPKTYQRMKGFAVNKLMGRKPPMPEHLRMELTKYFYSDVQALQKVIGRDLTRWLGK